jgi:serine/threonine protein kinase
MGNAARLTGKTLKGNKTGESWEVIENLSAPIVLRSAGPSNSHGYRVKNTANGKLGFLKAADADITGEEETMAVRLEALLMHHKFEARVSDHCHGNNMDRVCLAIDHGNTVINVDGLREPVFYLIFELADGDISDQIFTAAQWTLHRKFKLLHHVAVGLAQLHSANVSHNDMKPPNVLAYAGEHKVADLGQATRDDSLAPHDWVAVVGDPRYAPPEALYMQDGEPGTRILPNRLRQSGDLYLLGSLMYFLFSGRMMTPSVLDGMYAVHLPPFGPGGWQGTYAELVPFWRAAFAEEISEFRKTVSQQDNYDPKAYEEVISMLVQLCDPDPELRGHPLDTVLGRRTFSLQRYIAAFDRLSFRLQ